MPKKHQAKALLIKPGSRVVGSQILSQQDDSTPPSVNDLIRESRRLQIKSESAVSNPLTVSVPPNLRSVLSLPMPQAPAPRPGSRPSGPIRQRRIPGPPPPQSWLIDSRHAPTSNRDVSHQGCRVQARSSSLPGATFPTQGSLLHMTFKELAINWEWHAEYDGTYLATLPTSLKEVLMSYVGIYADNVHTSPLRLLFLGDGEVESRNEVTRLDLAGAIGTWTSLRNLASNLAGGDLGHASSAPEHTVTQSIPTSWDEAEQYESIETSIGLRGMAFKHLKHLSLALSPGKSASWKDLIRFASEISTVTSLSLAYWPQPTYTPRAASTRVVLKPDANHPGVVFGGSNIYTALDNDWREAAGILRSLSRMLYCLKWLDLTGCGDWFDALTWQPVRGTAGAEWNGSWRGVEYICLSVGWDPVQPKAEADEARQVDCEGWDVQAEREKYFYRKELERHEQISRSADAVVQHLRGVRKQSEGKWIDFEI